MYKSSPTTFLFIYIFPVAFIVLSTLNICINWRNGNLEQLGFTKAFIANTLWAAMFIIQMPFRLKNIVAADMGLLIKGVGKNASFIDYKDIIYIAKFDIINPFFMTIKYRDQTSGEYKKIFFIPRKDDQQFFKADKLTSYITIQMKKTTQTGRKNTFLLVLET